MKKLIEFRNIVKKFDNQTILKGINHFSNVLASIFIYLVYEIYEIAFFL